MNNCTFHVKPYSVEEKYFLHLCNKFKLRNIEVDYAMEYRGELYNDYSVGARAYKVLSELMYEGLKEKERA